MYESLADLEGKYGSGKKASTYRLQAKEADKTCNAILHAVDENGRKHNGQPGDYFMKSGKESAASSQSKHNGDYEKCTRVLEHAMRLADESNHSKDKPERYNRISGQHLKLSENYIRLAKEEMDPDRKYTYALKARDASMNAARVCRNTPRSATALAKAYAGEGKTSHFLATCGKDEAGSTINHLRIAVSSYNTALLSGKLSGKEKKEILADLDDILSICKKNSGTGGSNAMRTVILCVTIGQITATEADTLTQNNRQAQNSFKNCSARAYNLAGKILPEMQKKEDAGTRPDNASGSGQNISPENTNSTGKNSVQKSTVQSAQFEKNIRDALSLAQTIIQDDEENKNNKKNKENKENIDSTTPVDMDKVKHMTFTDIAGLGDEHREEYFFEKIKANKNEEKEILEKIKKDKNKEKYFSLKRKHDKEREEYFPALYRINEEKNALNTRRVMGIMKKHDKNKTIPLPENRDSTEKNRIDLLNNNAESFKNAANICDEHLKKFRTIYKPPSGFNNDSEKSNNGPAMAKGFLIRSRNSFIENRARLLIELGDEYGKAGQHGNAAQKYLEALDCNILTETDQIRLKKKLLFAYIKDRQRKNAEMYIKQVLDSGRLTRIEKARLEEKIAEEYSNTADKTSAYEHCWKAIGYNTLNEEEQDHLVKILKIMQSTVNRQQQSA